MEGSRVTHVWRSEERRGRDGRGWGRGGGSSTSRPLLGLRGRRWQSKMRGGWREGAVTVTVVTAGRGGWELESIVYKREWERVASTRTSTRTESESVSVRDMCCTYHWADWGTVQTLWVRLLWLLASHRLDCAPTESKVESKLKISNIS